MTCQLFQCRCAMFFTLAVGVLSPCTTFAAEENSHENGPERNLSSRQTILKQAGLWPLPEVRPNVPAIINHRRNHAGYSVENVALETAPHCFCTGNLYRPLLRHDLVPAVLFIDDTDTNKSFTSERQIVCSQLARMGITVLACNTSCHKSANNGRLDSSSTANIWNSLRAIDFLVGLE